MFLKQNLIPLLKHSQFHIQIPHFTLKPDRLDETENSEE